MSSSFPPLAATHFEIFDPATGELGRSELSIAGRMNGRAPLGDAWFVAEDVVK